MRIRHLVMAAALLMFFSLAVADSFDLKNYATSDGTTYKVDSDVTAQFSKASPLTLVLDGKTVFTVKIDELKRTGWIDQTNYLKITGTDYGNRTHALECPFSRFSSGECTLNFIGNGTMKSSLTIKIYIPWTRYTTEVPNGTIDVGHIKASFENSYAGSAPASPAPSPSTPTTPVSPLPPSEDKCPFALRVAQSDSGISIQTLESNKQKISVLKKDSSSGAFNKVAMDIYSTGAYKMLGGFFFAFALPKENAQYRFEQAINTGKQKYYPSESGYLDVNVSTGSCVIKKKI